GMGGSWTSSSIFRRDPDRRGSVLSRFRETVSAFGVSSQGQNLIRRGSRSDRCLNRPLCRRTRHADTPNYQVEMRVNLGASFLEMHRTPGSGLRSSSVHTTVVVCAAIAMLAAPLDAASNGF